MIGMDDDAIKVDYINDLIYVIFIVKVLKSGK